MNDLHTLLKQAEDSIAAEVEEISEFVFQHPELGMEEKASSAYLVKCLESHGFTVTAPYLGIDFADVSEEAAELVTAPYLGIDTAFRAELCCGSGKCKVAFLPEYDALPGYGPEGNENAHACGHNWIAASSLGAAIALSKLRDHLDATIVVIGTPAEETIGGKCDLVERGAFDDIDAAVQMHLGAENNINVITLAMDSIEFNFEGKAAHAAAYPQLGINALDAVQLMFAEVNALRQHMQSDARVAGIVTKGGAACRYYIRAAKRDYLKELTEKIINCAKGAALMTGAKLEYHNFENSYDDLVYHEGLRSLLRRHLSELGVEHFVDEDATASGSSDIGNVSQVCPCVYCEIDTGADPKVYAHNEDFLPYVHGEKAKWTLHTATKAMALTALDVFLDPPLLNA